MFMMRNSSEERHIIFKQAFKKLGLSQAEVARVMNLGDLSRAARNRVSDRLNGRTGITKDVALCIQLLCVIQDAGINITKLKFDHKGTLSV